MSSKTLHALALVFGFGGCILFSSCKKSNDDNSPSTASLVFNGTNIRFKSISATLSGSGAVITGTDSSKTISLSMMLHQPFVLNATVDMDSVGDEIMVTIPGRPDQWGAGFTWAPGDAKMTITFWDSANHRLAGNFSGVLSGGVGYSDTLSAGMFDVRYSAE